MLRRFSAAIAVALLLVTLSACAPACGSGAATGEAAVAALIAAAREADDPDDLCAYLAPGYTVSDDDLAGLQDAFADHPDTALSFQLGGQLGSTAQVVVTDGAFSQTFDVESNSDIRWTVAFGTLFG